MHLEFLSLTKVLTVPLLSEDDTTALHRLQKQWEHWANRQRQHVASRVAEEQHAAFTAFLDNPSTETEQKLLVTADADLTAILFTSAKIAFANAVNFLAGALMAVAQALWQALVEAVKNAITLFQIVTTADFWIGMGKAIMAIAQGFIAFLLDGVAKLLDWLSGIPLIGEDIGQGAKEVQSWADGVRQAGEQNKQASADLLTPAFDKAGNRMRETLESIGTALSEGFTKGSSLIDTSDWEANLSDTIGDVMDRVQKVSEKAREGVEPKKPTGPQLNLDDGEDKSKPVKNAVSAIQRIGGVGAAYSNGDPMLREQQRQTRELTTQTGLLRDVKRAIENKPTASNSTLSTVFA